MLNSKKTLRAFLLILAIFDLDDTLTLQDTDSLWQEYLVNNGLIDEKNYIEKRELFEKLYHAGILNFDDVISFSMGPLATLDYAAQKELQQDFALHHLNKIIIPQAQALVKSHFDRGHHVLIISAGHEFIIEPACTYFDVHDILCSRLIRDPCGKHHPLLKGAPLYREQKVQALLEWLNQKQISPITSYFYSDSINDLPLFEYVQIPIVVNPCPALTAVALDRNWQILDLKKEYLAQLDIFSR